MRGRVLLHGPRPIRGEQRILLTVRRPSPVEEDYANGELAERLVAAISHHEEGNVVLHDVVVDRVVAVGVVAIEAEGHQLLYLCGHI